VAVVTTVRRDADGGESPNSYIAGITAQVRVHWPPGTPLMDVMDTMAEAFVQTMRDVEAEHAKHASRVEGPV
jgi:hypothetical protein